MRRAAPNTARLPQIRFSSYVASYLLLGVSLAAAQERLGDDRHRYEPQPLLECSEASGRTGISIGDACLLVSGEARLALGYDSWAGLVGLHSELLSAMGVVASDFGPVFGVFTVRNEGNWPEDDFPYAVDGPSVYEAYLAAGEVARINANGSVDINPIADPMQQPTWVLSQNKAKGGK